MGLTHDGATPGNRHLAGAGFLASLLASGGQTRRAKTPLGGLVAPLGAIGHRPPRLRGGDAQTLGMGHQQPNPARCPVPIHIYPGQSDAISGYGSTHICNGCYYVASPMTCAERILGFEHARVPLRCSATQDCTTWNAVPVLAGIPLGLVQGIVRAAAVLPAHWSMTCMPRSFWPR